jgi:hypothetical protein
MRPALPLMVAYLRFQQVPLKQHQWNVTATMQIMTAAIR